VDPRQLRERVRAAGRALGLTRVGFAPTTPLPHVEALQRWLELGMAAGMEYMARTTPERHLPRVLLPTARTAVVVAVSCAGPADEPPAAGHGLVARYARGGDYHHLLRQALAPLANTMQALAGRSLQVRIAVDSSPLLERELAVAAGLGFIGKNTMLITPGLGSHTLLGVLLTDLELPPDGPLAGSVCGRCELCLQACPTGALDPYRLDARRCISGLTIEHRGPIDPSLSIDPWVFGCDVCQTVCPHNVGPSAGRHGAAAPPALQGPPSLSLRELLALRSGAHRRLVRGRALARSSRLTLIRNAALVAGAHRRRGELDQQTLCALRALIDHDDDGVRQAVRWALS